MNYLTQTLLTLTLNKAQINKQIDKLRNEETASYR